MVANTAEEKICKTILLVSVGLLYGGAETYYVKLAKILLPEYRVLAVVGCQRLADELNALGVVAVYTGDRGQGLKRYLSCFQACCKMIRRYRPGAAHLNGQPESYLALFLRLLRVRVLTTRHTPFTDQFLLEGSWIPVPIKRWMVLFSLQLADHTICVSQLLHRQLSAYLPSDRLSYIPTWVENEFLDAYERPVPSDPLRALFVGRVVENKGIFEVIEAVRRCDNVHLTVVGEGDQMEQAYKASSGLPVTFAGFNLDCKPAYRSSDLLIFPSREGFEGLPQVPLEAMAMRLPCLASDISCIQEINGGGVALALYRQGDVNDLACKLSHLATDKAALLQFGEAGRSQVELLFSVAAVTGPYLREFASAFK